MSVIFVPLIAAILFALVTANPAHDRVGWVPDLLIAIGFGLFLCRFYLAQNPAIRK
jgi:hypothetical protein